MTRPVLEKTYDYVIVGGGSGGCVIARRLVEKTDAMILLIEAGPSDVGVAEIADAGAWVSLLGGAYDWGYAFAPTPAVMGRSIPIPRGRVLGGSSSINAMMWYRGHPSDYDKWAAAGAEGWDFQSVLPYFKRAEDWEGGADPWRGSGGPLRIERVRDPHPVALALIEAAAQRGHAVIDDPNGATNEGVCLSNFNMSEGGRWSVAHGYLRPVMDHPNLTVLTGSQVLKLGIENGRCTFVTHLVDDRAHVTTARQEVILCAGAIDTPRLLMLSGIGPADELRRLDLPVIADLPGVGQNLQDHPLLTGINFFAKAPLGPLRDTGGGSMLNWKSAESPVADLHAFMVQGAHAGPELAHHCPPGRPVFAVSPGLMGSVSRGSVKLLEAGPHGRLEIQPNLLQEQADVDILAEAIETIMDIAEAPPLRALIESPALPSRRLSKVERQDFVRLSTSTFFHVCGTCAMGQGNATVVDPRLRVRGIDGLRIVDASVIPTIPTCNTNAPVVMIAERAADFIVEAA